MKKTIKFTAIIAIIMISILSGCMEHRYYQKNNQHTERYNQHHHRGARVDVNIHN